MPGSLIVVGTGITIGHLTAEARAWLTIADKVLYCVSDAVTERFILSLNADAESLYPFYGDGKQRRTTYDEMVERTMSCVREGQTVCVAYYGHPGIFVYPSHKAIEVAESEGFSARMLPAVSSLDCLFCDLGIDPAGGCQIFEATDLMLRQRHLDVGSHLIIFQVAALGDLTYNKKGYESKNISSLGKYLLKYYPSDLEIKGYEAAQYSVCEPSITCTTIERLIKEGLSGIHTLYVPPLKRPPVHLRMVKEYSLNKFLDGIQLIANEAP